MSEKIKGSLAGLIANIIFGFSFYFSAIALNSGVHPLLILSIRFTIAFLVMNILAAFGVFKISFKNKPYGRLLLMGLSQPFLYFIFELYGIRLVPTAVSGVIIGTIPAFVMLGSSLFLKEKATKKQWAFAVLSLICVGGISVISESSGSFSVLGVLLLILAVISAAAFNIFSRSVCMSVSAAERTYFMFLIAVIGFWPLTLIALKGSFVPSIVTALSSTQFLISVFFLAVLSSVVAFLLTNYCVKKAGLVRSASFSNIITVVSVPAGIFLLGEKISLLQLVLCLLIMVGVWGVNRQSEKQ